MADSKDKAKYFDFVTFLINFNEKFSSIDQPVAKSIYIQENLWESNNYVGKPQFNKNLQ